MKILLAEDDSLTRTAMETILCNEGFEVIAAADGTAAMRLFHEEKPDLALLDIMMPGLDGFTVCSRMRAVSPHIPVMFVSAKSEESDVAHGLHIGGDDFLRKPFGKTELVARVYALIRRSGLSPIAQSFRFGDWEVDTATMEARISNERSCDLTWRELSLLRLLHQRAGTVVSKEELIRTCWGMEYFPESRTLDQHILNLRKKLEADAAEPRLILTMRGIGYMHSL